MATDPIHDENIPENSQTTTIPSLKRILSPNSRRREFRRRRARGYRPSPLEDLPTAADNLTSETALTTSEQVLVTRHDESSRQPLPLIALDPPNLRPSSTPVEQTLSLASSARAEEIASEDDSTHSISTSTADRRRQFRRERAAGKLSSSRAGSATAKELASFKPHFSFSTCRLLTLHAQAPGTELQRKCFKNAREALLLLETMRTLDPNAYKAFATPSAALPAENQIRLAATSLFDRKAALVASMRTDLTHFINWADGISESDFQRHLLFPNPDISVLQAYCEDTSFEAYSKSELRSSGWGSKGNAAASRINGLAA